MNQPDSNCLQAGPDPWSLTQQWVTMLLQVWQWQALFRVMGLWTSPTHRFLQLLCGMPASLLSRLGCLEWAPGCLCNLWTVWKSGSSSAMKLLRCALQLTSSRTPRTSNISHDPLLALLSFIICLIIVWNVSLLIVYVWPFVTRPAKPSNDFIRQDASFRPSLYCYAQWAALGACVSLRKLCARRSM